jgi:hypothetical protein
LFYRYIYKGQVIFSYRVLSYGVFLGLSLAMLYSRFNRLNGFLGNF